MTFVKTIQNQTFARSAREALERAEDGPKKDTARRHFREADAAELGGNEAGWILAIARAFRALE